MKAVQSLRRIRGVAVALLLTAMTTGAAQAQEEKTAEVEQTTFGDWSVRCVSAETGKRCIMVQILKARQDQSQLLRFELNAVAENDAAQGFMVLPFGVDVNKGVSMSIDGGARFNLAYRTCRTFGCVVPATFSSGAVQAMQQGSQIAVTIYTIDGENSFDVPVSLKGFTAAFNALKS